MSEIDAIFSLDGGKATTSKSAVAGPSVPKKKKSKSKQVASSSLAESNPSPAAASDGDKKKKRKRVEAADDVPVVPRNLPSSDKKSSSKPKKVKEAVTILDPSAAIEAPASGSKSKNKKTRPIPNGKKEPPADLESFTNSRGAGRARTEEGFAIYSENELKLDQGGNTPLCPFDCDCCF